MNDLPESLFANPIWQALRTKHRHLAVCAGDACRYPADVTPFAAVAAPTPTALMQLHSLLAPGESVWLIGEIYPPVPEVSYGETMECLQMVLPETVAIEDSETEIVRLSEANVPEMVALTDVAFPGLFRKRTIEMGSYYGARSDGELVAMAGERFKPEGRPEISGVCTHPVHRGKGLAASLIWRLVRDHRRDGLVSWLHVASENHNATQLYRRMGFTAVRKVKLHRVSRKA